MKEKNGDKKMCLLAKLTWERWQWSDYDECSYVFVIQQSSSVNRHCDIMQFTRVGL